MADVQTCVRCGSHQRPDSPKGLCPRCLMIQAFEDADDLELAQPVAALERTLAPAPGSARTLTSMGVSLVGFPSVLLRDAAGEGGPHPVVKPFSPEMPRFSDRGDRYQLFGEIARGGMGAVLKGRDVDLGRDLAVKVLLDSHKEEPELVKRFIEEAQIAGQLQHPGIVPVYELGAFADRRPYFTMKLVKGRTLAELLMRRLFGR